jgi:hypothetical protein
MVANVGTKQTWKSGLTIGAPPHIGPVWADLETQPTPRYPATSRDLPPLGNFFYFFSPPVTGFLSG